MKPWKWWMFDNRGDSTKRFNLTHKFTLIIAVIYNKKLRSNSLCSLIIKFNTIQIYEPKKDLCFQIKYFWKYIFFYVHIQILGRIYKEIIFWFFDINIK